MSKDSRTNNTPTPEITQIFVISLSFAVFLPVFQTYHLPPSLIQVILSDYNKHLYTY